MCTLVILRRPESDWPLIVAANRDEMADRAWQPPARHWPDRPQVVAGRDELAGGTWLGVNDHGVAAGILNRDKALGPAAGYRSRGELPLEALDHAEAEAAAEALSHLEAASYRAFNMVVADAARAYWLCSREGEEGAPRNARVTVQEIPEGVSMITAFDLNDPGSPRTNMFLSRFRDARPPDPGTGDWSHWQALMESREHDPDIGPKGAMTVVTDYGFGTVSSSMIALPRPEPGRKPVWVMCPGRPGDRAYAPVPL